MARDLLGRVVADFPVSEMMSRLKDPTNNTISNNEAKKDNATEDKLYAEIKKLVQQIDSNSEEDQKKSQSWVKSIIDFVNVSKTSKENNKDTSIRDQTAYMAIMAEATTKLWQASQSQNTLWVGLSHLTSRAQKDIANAIDMSNCCRAANKGMSEAVEKISKSSEASSSKIQEAIHQNLKTKTKTGSRDATNTTADSDAGELGDTISATGKRGLALALFFRTLNGSLSLLTETMQGLDLRLEKAFPSMIDETNFRESIRSIVHIQNGYGNLNREIESSLLNIEQNVYASGVSRAKFQTILIKNLERGLAIETESDRLAVAGLAVDKKEDALLKIRQKRTMSIQTTALNTASLLNMSAEGTNEIFMDWHYQLGLSSIQLAEIGRHMQFIGRTSGLSGAQLEKAMQSANNVIKSLQKQGSASVTVMKNITAFMATAEKLGLESSQDLMLALSDTDAFFESKMGPFLTQAASRAMNPELAMKNLTFGTTMEDKDSIKNLLGGMRKQATELFKGAGIDIDLMKDPLAMSKELQRMRASGDEVQQAMAMQIQHLFKSMGVPIGELEKQMQALEASSMSASEQLDKAQKNLDEMKGLEGLDKFKQQQKLVQNLQTDLYADAFGKLTKYKTQIDAVGGIENLDEKTMKTLQIDLKEQFGSIEKADEFLKNMSLSSSTLIANLEERGKEVGIKDLSKKLEEIGGAGTSTASIIAGLQSGDQRSAETLNQLLQQIQKEEKAAQDPFTQIRRQLENANTYLGQIAQDSTKNLSTNMVAVMFGVSTISDLLSSLVTYVVAGKLLQGMLGRGGVSGGGVPGGGAATGGASTTPPKRSWLGRTKDWITGTKPTTTVPQTVPPTIQPPPVQTGTGPASAGGTGKMMPKLKGRAALLALGGTILAGAGAYLWSQSGKKESPEGGLPEDGDVLSILKQIEINTRCLCEGKSGGTIEGASANTTTPEGLTSVGNNSLLTDAALGASMFIPSSSVGKAMGFAQPQIVPATSNVTAAASAATPPSATSTAGKSGGVLSSMWNKTKGAFGTIGEKFSSAKASVGSAYQSAKGAVGGVYQSAKGAVGGAYENVKGAAKQFGGFVADKAGITKATEIINTKMKDMLPKFLLQGGGMLKSGLGNILNKIPVVGAIIQSIITGMDVNEIAKRQGVTKDEIYSQIGQSVLSGGLELIAGTMAGSLGAIAGSVLGPIGSFVTGAGAYMGGAWLGRTIGHAISDYVGGPTLGKMIFDMFYEGKGTANQASVEPVSVPAFEVGTREIKQGGLAELHKGEMVMPASIWNKIIALGSGAFGSGNADFSKISSIGDVMKNFLAPASGLGNLYKKYTFQKTSDKQESNTKQFESLLQSLKELINVIKSKKCCEVGTSLTGAFEGDQATEAIDSEMNRSLKMQTLKINEESEPKKFGKAQMLKTMIGMDNSSQLGSSLINAFETVKNKIKETFTSVSNLGLFDYEKSAEAQEKQIESLKNAAQESSKLEPKRFSFVRTDVNQSEKTITLSDMLTKTFEKLKDSAKLYKDILIPKSLGLFDKENAKEAEINDLQSKVMTNLNALNGVEAIRQSIKEVSKVLSVDVVGKSMGLFDPEKSQEANDDYIQQTIMRSASSLDLNNIVKSYVGTRKSSSKTEKNIVADVNTNMLDYSDDMKGQVGSLGLSRVSAETQVAQEKYGQNASGSSAILPSMDSIADYLIVEQAKKLDQMIHVMEQIRDGISARGPMGSEIIGANTDLLSPPTRTGIKNISKDFTRGAWDLTFGDYSSGVVTTDGRGGN